MAGTAVKFDHERVKALYKNVVSAHPVRVHSKQQIYFRDSNDIGVLVAGKPLDGNFFVDYFVNVN